MWFLGTSKHLYNSVCPLVGLFGLSVGWLVGPHNEFLESAYIKIWLYVEIASPSRVVWIILVKLFEPLFNVKAKD
jgi:hypothetical protein